MTTMQYVDAATPDDPISRPETQSWLQRHALSIKDTPGVYLELPLDELEVDLAYQRDPKKRAMVRKIAREWSWIACGALTVANRGECFRVLDGGGRTLAARLRGGITTLPSMVFEVESIREEAEAFVRINKDRTGVKPAERFKAELAQGNPVALKVQRLIDDSGRDLAVTSGVHGIACIDCLMTLVNADEAVLWEMWPVMKELSAGHPFHKRLIEGLFYMQRHAVNGQSLRRKPWSTRLIGIGHAQLMAAIELATAHYQKGGYRVYAEGITNRLNKGLRINTWELPSTSQDDEANA